MSIAAAKNKRIAARGPRYLRRLVSETERPESFESNKGRYISCCLRDGLTLQEAYAAFERANRRLWAEALSR